MPETLLAKCGTAATVLVPSTSFLILVKNFTVQFKDQTDTESLKVGNQTDF